MYILLVGEKILSVGENKAKAVQNAINRIEKIKTEALANNKKSTIKKKIFVANELGEATKIFLNDNTEKIHAKMNGSSYIRDGGDVLDKYTKIIEHGGSNPLILIEKEEQIINELNERIKILTTRILTDLQTDNIHEDSIDKINKRVFRNIYARQFSKKYGLVGISFTKSIDRDIINLPQDEIEKYSNISVRKRKKIKKDDDDLMKKATEYVAEKQYKDGDRIHIDDDEFYGIPTITHPIYGSTKKVTTAKPMSYGTAGSFFIPSIEANDKETQF